MSNLAEITFSILDTVRPDNLTDTSITPELIQYHIKNVRAQLARQQIGKYGTLPNQWFQPLGCVTIIQADASECCEYPSECKILRTDVVIPNTIEAATALLKVGSADVTSKPFQQIEAERAPFEGTNKYTKDLVKWFVNRNNGYIYLLVNKDNAILSGIETINIQGAVLEDPLDASTFNSCSTGETCFSPNSNYPIPDSIVPILQEMIIKKFVQMQSTQPIDVSNDAKTNPDTTINRGV